jgi:dihydroorotate dehydrogenase (fumarate)
MADLKTKYLGLELKNPMVASASPLSRKVETAVALEKTGVSAIIMYSLFEEQIIQESYKLDRDLSRGIDAYAEALDFFPQTGDYSIGPENYLDHLTRVKKAVNIPVIGSLNGVTPGGWVEYAQKIEAAGADAVELNLYYLATDPATPSSELEAMYVELVNLIRNQVQIPLAVKLSPFITSLPNFAKQLVEAGADGLVLFNRFYQPDFDLEELVVTPNLVLSNSNELRLPLRWIAILYGRVQTDYALTSGIHTGEDMVKALMAGASVTMVASEFLQNGIERAAQILADADAWLDEHEYDSVGQMIGSMSQQSVEQPAEFERANYVKVLNSY